MIEEATTEEVDGAVDDEVASLLDQLQKLTQEGYDVRSTRI